MFKCHTLPLKTKQKLHYITYHVFVFSDEQSKTFLLESDPAKCLQSYQQHEQPGGGNGRGR